MGEPNIPEVNTTTADDEANAETLKNIYYNLKNPEAYSTVERLFRATAGKIPREKITEWLGSQLAFTLHKPKRINFKRNHYNLDNINQQWQADLLDLQSLSRENDGFKYILLVIDAFSRVVRVRPLKTKSAIEVLNAFKSIVCEVGRHPLFLVTDRGKEFFNNLLTKYLQELHTVHYAPSDDKFKAAFAERAIRSYKDVLFKILTATLKLRYIDHIQDIANLLNSRSIGMPPNSVNATNIYAVWKYMRNHRDDKRVATTKLANVKVDDYVRLAKNKSAMDKGFLPNWTDEIFKVVKTLPRKRVVHELEDAEGKQLEGTFYDAELQKVTKNNETLYRVDKVLKKRRYRGIREVFVSWFGYNKTHNCWIPEEDLINNDAE
jgi:Integrase core domain